MRDIRALGSYFRYWGALRMRDIRVLESHFRCSGAMRINDIWGLRGD